MPSLKQLRRRIRTVKNTKLITRAMRSVSASKMRRAQDRRNHAKPYAEHLLKLVARLAESGGLNNHPITQRREVKKRLVVLFSSDRGLCGAFNTTVLRFAEEFLKTQTDGETELYIIGRRANEYFRKQRWPVVCAHTDFLGKVDAPRILKIGKELNEEFLAERYDEVHLIHNYPITAMTYRPQRSLFLPLDPKALAAQLSRTRKEVRPVDYLFEPNPQAILAIVLPKYMETRLFFAFADAFVAEHQARMLAMSTANENCEELMGTLTLHLNKIRQAAITKEILEIVGGADALKG